MKQYFSEESPLVLVGCGNMGRAMAEGWLAAGVPAEALFVIDPMAKPGALPDVPASNYAGSAAAVPEGLKARVIIAAVKPQMFADVLPGLQPLVGDKTVLISVAAGITLANMKEYLGVPAALVRAMPNTPASVGAGITGVTATPDVSDVDKELALALMASTGAAVWVDDEGLINSVTGVSGSGPAYIFNVVEAMAAAGVKEGLPEEDAMKLARQTVIGAARLMEANPDVPAAELRRRVTSPGGTTAAALAVLMNEEDGLGPLMARAVNAARRRGEELAG